MSLLGKQDLQDICGHTALRARKWSGFICKRTLEDTTIALSLLKKEEKEDDMMKKKNTKLRILYFARCVRKIALYSDIIQSFDRKSAVEQDDGVSNV